MKQQQMTMKISKTYLEKYFKKFKFLFGAAKSPLGLF